MKKRTRRNDRMIWQMDLRLQLRSWAVNVFLLLFGLYAVLGSFALVNFLNLPYSPLTGELPGTYTIHLILFSPSLDENILFALSAVVLVFPWVTSVWKHALGLTLLSALFLILRLVVHLLGAPTVGEVFLILAGFTSLATILLVSPKPMGLSRRRTITRFLICSFSLLLVVEIVSVACLSLYPFNQHLPQNRPLWRFVDLENQMFQVPTNLVTIIFTLTLLSWIIKPLWAAIKSFPKWGTKINRKISKFGSLLLPNSKSDNKHTEECRSKLSVIILGCSMAFTIFYILYPFILAGSLTKSVSWSWDLDNYVRMLHEIGEQEGAQSVPYAFSRFQDRALSLLFMYAAWQVTGSSVWTVVKFTPMLLAPLLPLAVFFFMLQAIGDSFNSSLAALFTVFSFHTTVGFKVAYLSNWMALILVYLSSGLLLKSLRQKSWKWMPVAASTTILLLFTHAHTWVMLMVVLGVFTVILGVEWLRARGSLFDLKALGATIATNLSADLTKNILLSATLGVAKETTQLGLRTLAWENVSRYWSTVHSAFRSWSGSYNNSTLLLLALLGTLVLLCRKKRYHTYLLSFLVAASFPFILGTKNVQIRIIYNLPLQILALLGLISVSKLIKMRMEPMEGTILAATLVLLVILINVNYALRCTVYMAGYMHPV
jgi:hypothetical protein